jgi:hypothetical protein
MEHSYALKGAHSMLPILVSCLTLAPPGQHPDDVTAAREITIPVEGVIYRQVKTGRGDELRRQPFAGAIVYLSATKQVNAKPPDEPVVVRLKGGKITPDFTSVVVGQKLIARFDDDRLYNLISFSPVEPPVGVAAPPDPHNKFEKVFKAPTDNARLICGVHPTVQGRIVVTPNPVVTRSGPGGQFMLPVVLPPGEYEVTAFHPSYGRARGKIDIRLDAKSACVKLLLPLQD